MADQQLSQYQGLRQELSLNTRQLQSLEILQAPVWELQEKLQEIIAANPVLEFASVPGEEIVPPERFTVRNHLDVGNEDEEEAAMAESADNWSENLPMLDRGGDDYYGADDRAQEKHDYLLNSLASAPTLYDQLVEELAFQSLTPRQRSLIELVIDSLDVDGYLRTSPADLAMAGNAGDEEIAWAIRQVQSFDPPGIGARSLGECLELQLRRKGETDPLPYAILHDHLEAIAQNRLPQVARMLGVSVAAVNEALRLIRSLNPAPGLELARADTPYVQPELAIVQENGEFVVEEEAWAVPRPRLSEQYLEMFEHNSANSEERAYLREKIAAARELLRALDQRQNTLRRIAAVIARTQRDFFAEGVEALRPLTMRQVADELGLHETTISRALANKYVSTPQGLFEFRFFFTTGYAAGDGESVSNRSVMERIRAMIDGEDGKHPLSDEKISQMLKEEGLQVARRTVAKYREEMSIPATPLRRRFD